MKLTDQAIEILTALGLPHLQTNERSALTLLSLAAMRKQKTWQEADRPLLRIVDIMDWMRKHFKKDYAPNSRETVRRQTIHQFEQARIVNKNIDDPGRATNSGLTNYQLTPEVLPVLKSYGTKAFQTEVDKFLLAQGSLKQRYSKERSLTKVKIKLSRDAVVYLSAGKHNVLQRAVIEDFAPRFVKESKVIYLGDTADKHAWIDSKKMKDLRIPFTEHDKLPDIVIYNPKKNWLFLIEAVTSHGPISPKRHEELTKMFKDCPCGIIFVTAFLNFTDFKKYAVEIVWESEVWIAEAPDHMIHYNGDKFLGPQGEYVQTRLFD